MAEPCWSIVRKPKGFETSNDISLKKRIEDKDDLNNCRIAIEELLQNLIDGEKFPKTLVVPVINRYQMNNDRDKRIKKLLYILWEYLPKKGRDGRFLNELVMACGGFDKDLKHPNPYVCGSVLRALSKTLEPEVITQLVHSIEKCLELGHAYQRKNAFLAIAKIYKNFPDLNPSAPKLISECLSKEKDDECKRAALQALLEIDPDEAKSFLHSCNIADIHCMNASIQLLFVELIQRLFKKGSEDSESYIMILKSLIKSSSSPSVRYQAAVTLTKFSRDPESIQISATCFIEICAKDCDNNVKLIALNSIMSLRRFYVAERVLRNSIMDIICILQSATDLELHEKILKLTLDLVSALNVGGVVSALRHEMRKIQNTNVLSSQVETIKYRRLLVDTVYKIADRFPNAIIEFEMLDTLFDLLLCESVEDRTSSRLISLFKVFMLNNPIHQGVVIKKIQQSFNQVKDNSSTHRGLIHLLGDFSETKEQIERTYQVFKDSLGELPIVASELRKAQQATEGSGDDTGDGRTKKGTASNGDIDLVTKNMSKLVTADGSYATQSAINYQQTSGLVEEHPPLRSYYLRNKFDTASVLCYALLKMACRYQQVDTTGAESDKMLARFIAIVASILNLGHSNMVDSDGNPIRIKESKYLFLSLNILQKLTDKHSDLAKSTRKIVTEDMRTSLGSIVKDLEQDRFSFGLGKKSRKEARFDDKISISLFSSRDEDLGFVEDGEEKDDDLQRPSMPDIFGGIPLTGTGDRIYAYCEFDVNQYDIRLNIHLENRTQDKTFENVTLELAARGDGTSNIIDRPESIVLAPLSAACIMTNVKVVSAENRRLFGSITFDDVTSDYREQVIMLNDISVNITDYIRPSSISFDDFNDIWRECEWENKVTVKTKLTNLKEYLEHLVVATNMRCITADKNISGDCTFLSANLYAKSSFGEEALVNVSIEKETHASVVTGNVKIRSRSQGMALSLGEKITATQNATSNPVSY